MALARTLIVTLSNNNTIYAAVPASMINEKTMVGASVLNVKIGPEYEIEGEWEVELNGKS